MLFSIKSSTQPAASAVANAPIARKSLTPDMNPYHCCPAKIFFCGITAAQSWSCG